jgi:hypothetical protein
MLLTLDAKRRLTVPAALAPARAGDAFDAYYDQQEDEIILRRVTRRSNWLEVWRQCPIPMDDVPPRSRQMPKKLKL